MLKVIAACGNGMGSSQIIKMKIDKIFRNLKVSAQIHHCSIGEAKTQASNYDVVFCSEALKDNFKNAQARGTKVIGLKNLLSEAEIKEKIIAEGLDK